MAKTGSTETFDRFFLLEKSVVAERDRTAPARQLRAIRRVLLDQVREVGRSGDLDLILDIERRFLENDLAEYANSKGMAASLTAALSELAAAMVLVAKVRAPAVYRATDDDHSLPRNRVGGLPRDQARQFFSSHTARLLNQDKSRLDPEEKLVIDQRKANIRAAERLYAALQRRALGLPPTGHPAKEPLAPA